MKYVIKSASPVHRWVEGTPMGNGYFGFMHYTNEKKEIFSFNHDSLFRSNITKKIDTKNTINPIRQCIEENDSETAQKIFMDAVKDLPESCNPYQPLADLTFDFETKAEYKYYCRTLDLEKAVMNVSYELDKNTIKWEVFVSNPQGLAAIKVLSSKPTSMKLTWSREEDPECKYDTKYTDKQAVFNGEFVEGQSFYAALMLDGNGTVICEDDGILCRDFTQIVVYVRVGLGTPDEFKIENSYEEIKKEHITDFGNIYNRFLLTLNEESQKSSEEIYDSAVNKRNIHTDVYEYIINMARYVMISSSREGTKPMNLQGIWCNDLKPEWDCGYTTDINIEMCYWMSNVLNLSDCQRPLFDWVTSNIETMNVLAKDIFGVENSAYIPQYTDLYMTPTCWKEFSPFQLLWSGAAAWLAEHFFEYWKYSNDDEFMRKTAYPYMKMCANFYIEFLVKNDQGIYELIPACNPENWTSKGAQITKTTAMDIALIHELTDNLIYVNEKLNLNDINSDKWADINKNIKSYYIEKDGALSEFTTGDIPMDPYHRHLSHIYGLYPAKTFMNDNTLSLSAKKSIENRLEHGLVNSATWSMAWYCCCFARMGDGNTALDYLDHIIKGGLMKNFLTSHNDWRENSEYSMLVSKKIFQVEGLMGAAAGMAEMLITCNNDITILLPALPNKWESGKVCGLCGYGAFEYNIEWHENKAKTVDIYSKKGGELRLKIATEYKTVSCNHIFEKRNDLLIFDNVKVNEKIKIILEV